MVDASGVGTPVLEIMRDVRMGCRVAPTVITSGQQAKGRGVPRAELVANLQMMAQRGRNSRLPRGVCMGSC